jgi:hypothetical protein
VPLPYRTRPSVDGPPGLGYQRRPDHTFLTCRFGEPRLLIEAILEKVGPTACPPH